MTNYSKRKTKTADTRLKKSGQKLQAATLLITWDVDAGNIGSSVNEQFVRQFEAVTLAEIEPIEYFPLNGVNISENLVLFPQSTFFLIPEHNLILFHSTVPLYDWYQFISQILDFSDQLGVTEIYTAGGMISLNAHTAPRELMANFNTREFKQKLHKHGVSGDMNYETPAGQRPTISSFLSWAARRRDIPTACLWMPVPFYLVNTNDAQSCKRLLSFFKRQYGLPFDFTSLDKEIKQTDQRIADLRIIVPEVDEYIGRLENNLELSEEESQKLAIEIEKSLNK